MSKWNWISSATSVVVGLAIFIFAIYLIYKALTPDPFRPLEMFPIIIDTPVVQAGDMLVVRDGFCNKNPSNPRLVEIYAYLQASETDRARANGIDPTIDVVGTNESPAVYTLYRCLGTEPVKLQIPESVSPGEYTLTIRVITRGRTGQIQNEVRPSGVFEIVSASVD